MRKSPSLPLACDTSGLSFSEGGIASFGGVGFEGAEVGDESGFFEGFVVIGALSDGANFAESGFVVSAGAGSAGADSAVGVDFSVVDAGPVDAGSALFAGSVFADSVPSACAFIVSLRLTGGASCIGGQTVSVGSLASTSGGIVGAGFWDPLE